MTVETAGARRPAIPVSATVALVGTLGSIYTVSQFLRNSIGVIAPDLAAELQLSAGEIGVLSSAFFFAFAAAQIPLGVALDRYGPRRCMLFCTAVAVAGTVLFALATVPWALVVARVLMGIGSSCYLMAPLALYARRYEPDRFAMFVGLQLGLGSIGTLLATAPLAFAVGAVGWRVTFLLVAGLVLLAGLLVALIVREDQAQHPHHEETIRESVAGILEALRTPSVVPLFLMQLAAYSSFVLLVGLWGGPYLTHIYGYDLSARGQLLFLAAIAQVIGAMAWGPSDRLFGSYKTPVFIGTVMTALSLAAIALFGVLPVAGLIVCFAGLGFFSAYTSVLIAHGKSLFPARLVGRGMTLLNMGTMGGVFLTQTMTGFVIDLFGSTGGAYPLAAYRLVFALQATFLIAAGLTYIRARDPRRPG
jgi:MFS family permease